jgi:hypothetical protein
MKASDTIEIRVAAYDIDIPCCQLSLRRELYRCDSGGQV